MNAKNFFISKIPQDQIMEGFEGFEFAGNEYDFKLEVQVVDGFVRLYDSLERMVPIDISQLEEVIVSLQMAYDLMNKYQQYTNAIAELKAQMQTDFDSAAVETQEDTGALVVRNEDGDIAYL